MISMKEAIWVLEHFERDLEANIFFMDMRPMGKDYEAYYQRAQKRVGVSNSPAACPTPWNGTKRPKTCG